MKELALHILDIVENSIRAGSSFVQIAVIENPAKDQLIITISDDGCGMDTKMLEQATDPFFTTKDVRSVGMGLSLFRQAAERTGGNMRVASQPGSGTRVEASFKRSHIDRQPLGDMASTITMILLANPKIDLVYRHCLADDEFVFDTRTIRSVLDGVSVTSREVIQFISRMIKERQNLD